MATHLEQLVTAAVLATLPVELQGCLRRVSARPGWGKSLAVDVRTPNRDLVAGYRGELLLAIEQATGLARIALNVDY